jgi:hypothetical protein
MSERTYTNLIFDKGVKNIPWRKHSFFNKCCQENWISASRELKLVPCLSPYTSINSNWINDLNRRLECLKLVQERSRNTLEAISIGNDFLSRTKVTQQLRERNHKRDFMKLKVFCTVKEMVSTLKKPPTGWEKIFAAFTRD